MHCQDYGSSTHTRCTVSAMSGPSHCRLLWVTALKLALNSEHVIIRGKCLTMHKYGRLPKIYNYMEVTHNTNPSLLERQTPIRQNIDLTDLWLHLQLSWMSWTYVHTHHQSGTPQTTSNVTQEQTQLGTRTWHNTEITPLKTCDEITYFLSSLLQGNLSVDTVPKQQSFWRD